MAQTLSIATCVLLLALAKHCAAAAVGAQREQAWATYSTTAAASARAGLAYVARVTLRDELLREYGPSFKQLSVEVTPETASRLHVKVRPRGHSRWEVPEFVVPRPGAAPGLASSSLQYEVLQPSSADAPFALTVLRKATGQPVFDTRGHRFVFKDQYIELTTNVPKDSHLYGLGEVTLPTGLLLPRDGRVLTLWARDFPAAIPDFNLYGSHPFYLQLNADGSAHGVLFLNSNGMDVQLNPTTVTYKAIGGLVDLYFFMGPTPEAVIRQYHEVIGAPALPPYWALGLHQSRWGYRNVEVLSEVVANYSAAGLPLETVWSDIEYMPKRFWTMALDEHRFPAQRMRALVDKLHANGQQWIAITDAGVAVDRGYNAYEHGSKDKVWITDASGAPYQGQVWPGTSVYPDYMENPATAAWLRTQLEAWHAEVPFDGLWLDMNEASNFCSGTNCVPNSDNETALYWLEVETPRDFDINELIPHRTSCQMTCSAPADDNTLDNPPYALQQTGGLRLHEKTISPSALHANGARQYDTHNLFGTSMAAEHHAAVTAMTGKRPFLLSRSTFPGAGKWTAHWTGDNGANWENLWFSIAGVLNTNMWGMAMAGSDICGFLDELVGHPEAQLPEEELQQLCNRWASAGAFYPFSRNHYSYNSRPHEFYRWPDVTAAAKKAYTLRYRLLTYLYSSLFLAHSRGGTVARPLFFTDPSDLAARNATAQWMLGESLLVSPVVTPNTNTLRAHFTAGAWYSAWDYRRLDVATGGPVRLRVPLGDIAVHYRGGSIVPLQQYAPVTRDVRLSPVTLVVALPGSPSTGSSAAGGPLPPYALEDTCAAAHGRNPGQLVSCGFLFMDGGADLQVTPQTSVQVWFTAVASPDGKSGSITSTVKANGGDAKGRLRLEAVHVLGAPRASGSVVLEAARTPVVLVNGEPAEASYNEATGAITLAGLSHVIGAPLSISWRL